VWGGVAAGNTSELNEPNHAHEINKSSGCTSEPNASSSFTATLVSLSYPRRRASPVCKLLTFRRKIRQLEQSPNPAAFIILAQLRALQTRGASKSRQRLLFKWALARRLYESGQAKQDVLDLFRLIDWLITLPKNLDLEFRHRQVTYTQENTMPYITSTERLAREEGLEAGREAGREEASSRIVLRLLKRRFELDDGDVADVKSLTVEQAMDLSEEQMDFTSVNDLRIWLAVKRK
jgi:Domain of unknown function (DUF4351)